ncbi:hypothetical protein BU25DRAFT_421174 [Macroventuria anomochaeta]|uniref:Uncharacterized protein n=1 Tax=Macroventuria anomochaeta TaxID=301207 RepID=A0ACB6S3S9_9PLEO|nr:uncharacterized protein BU25DRAFT_421174 [Macroventuria anomochaeta]KAF2628182.1 hypothetical protein BU25DRAFT_421174 [Macroventuria anomochaeta]
MPDAAFEPAVVLEQAVQQVDASGKVSARPRPGFVTPPRRRGSGQWNGRNPEQFVISCCAVREKKGSCTGFFTEATVWQAKAGSAELISIAWCHSWVVIKGLVKPHYCGTLPPLPCCVAHRTLSSAPRRIDRHCNSLQFFVNCIITKASSSTSRICSRLAWRLKLEVVRFHLGTASNPKETLARARPQDAQYVRTLPSPWRHSAHCMLAR